MKIIKELFGLRKYEAWVNKLLATKVISDKDLLEYNSLTEMERQQIFCFLEKRSKDTNKELDLRGVLWEKGVYESENKSYQLKKAKEMFLADQEPVSLFHIQLMENKEYTKVTIINHLLISGAIGGLATLNINTFIQRSSEVFGSREISNFPLGRYRFTDLKEISATFYFEVLEVAKTYINTNIPTNGYFIYDKIKQKV